MTQTSKAPKLSPIAAQYLSHLANGTERPLRFQMSQRSLLRAGLIELRSIDGGPAQMYVITDAGRAAIA